MFDLNAIINTNFYENFRNCHISTVFSFYDFDNFETVIMSICLIAYKINYSYVKHTKLKIFIRYNNFETFYIDRHFVQILNMSKHKNTNFSNNFFIVMIFSIVFNCYVVHKCLTFFWYMNIQNMICDSNEFFNRINDYTQ